MQTYGVNVFVQQDEKVLLTLRSDFPVWCLPGGAIEAGETLVEAGRREVWEEAGAEVEIVEIVGVYSRPNWGVEGNHEVVFRARQIGGELIPKDGEAVEVAYFALDDLPNGLLWWHRERIEDAVQQNGVVARRQDVRWPLPGVSYAESKRLVAEGALSVQKLIDCLCVKPAQDDSYLELGRRSGSI